MTPTPIPDEPTGTCDFGPYPGHENVQHPRHEYCVNWQPIAPMPNEGAREAWLQAKHLLRNADKNPSLFILRTASFLSADEKYITALTTELAEARRERDEAQATIRSGNDYMRALEQELAAKSAEFVRMENAWRAEVKKVQLGKDHAPHSALMHINKKLWNDTLAQLARANAVIAELEAALNQHGHVLHLNEEGWSIEHPVECREIGLTKCAEHEYVVCEIDVLKESYGLGDFSITYRSEGETEWLDIKNLNDEASDSDESLDAGRIPNDPH